MSALNRPFTEKDYEWLRWSLDLSIGDYRTPEASRDELVALRAKLAQVDESVPLSEQITQDPSQQKMGHSRVPTATELQDIEKWVVQDWRGSRALPNTKMRN